jgi:hypothetical protein
MVAARIRIYAHRNAFHFPLFIRFTKFSGEATDEEEVKCLTNHMEVLASCVCPPS